jgi:prepilin-type N-terminal cleavage/methylation domain-containing protein
MVTFNARSVSRVRRAFTMLEVVVVLMIVGVVSTLSAGRIHAIIVKERVQRASTSLQSDLQAAFAIASRNRRPIRISWNSAKMQMDVTDRAGTTFYRRTPLGNDYGFTSSAVAFSASPIEVYPNGFASDTLTVVLSSDGNTRRVHMTRTGMVVQQ